MDENNFNFYPDTEKAPPQPTSENTDAFSVPQEIKETEQDTFTQPADIYSGEVQDAFSENEKKEQSSETVSEPVNQTADFPSVTPPAYQPASQEYVNVGYTQPVSPAAPQAPAYTAPEAPYNPYAPRNAANQPSYGGYDQYQQPPYSQMPPQMPYQPSGSSKGKIVAAVLVGLCIIAAIIFIAGAMLGVDKAQDNMTSAVVGEDASSQQKTTLHPEDNTTLPETTVTDSLSVSTTNPASSVPNSVYVAEKVRPSVVGVMVYVDGELYGEGSGVLMSEKDGWTYVITCAHVIDEENVTYGILLLDGTSLKAELVAFDTRTDIGVVKVNKTGLPLAEFGDSSTLKVGEPIYAIGNPGGSEYFGSITDGIVAAIDRSVTSTYTMTCIQHNAAINPGNSGGALVNTAGQIIGINSAKIASTEFEGMGFAVPTSIASPVVDALINYGYVPNRPKLGIEYSPVSTNQLYSIIVSIKDLPQGALIIASIAEDSSLIGTQAQVGDLIIGVNGKNMDDSSVLLDLIETGKVGDTLTLTLCRIDKRTYKISTFDVVITLVEDKGSN